MSRATMKANGDYTMRVYWCRHCERFHIGHAARRQQSKIRDRHRVEAQARARRHCPDDDVNLN